MYSSDSLSNSARRAFETLGVRSADLPEADRRVYYAQLCASSLAFIEWREHGLDFESQLQRFLHVPAAPAAEDEIRALELHLSLQSTFRLAAILASTSPSHGLASK